MADDREVGVRFGAKTDGFAAGVQRATAEMRRTQAAFKESASDALALDNALAKYLARLDPTYKAQKLLADGLVLLDRNLAAGNISASTHAATIAKLEATYGKTANGVAEGAGRISFATAGVSRELIVLGHEAVTGNWTRMPGSMMVLAERVGGLHHIFAALASPVGIATIAIGGTVAVLGFLAARAVHANMELTKLNATMEATGRAGVVNEANMRNYITQLARLPGINKEAAESIVTHFSQARKIGGVMFDQLVRIVGDFAYVTGQKAPDAAKELAKAFSDPAKGAKDLDAQLGILTAAQLRQIETLMRQGDTMRAQQVLFDALKDRIQGLSDRQLSWAKFTEILRERWALMMLTMGGDADTLMRLSIALGEIINKMRGLSGGSSSVRMQVTNKPVQGGGRSDADTIKDTLAATQNVISLDERRKALSDEILRIKNALKVATGEEATILGGRLLEAEKQLHDLRGKHDMTRVQAMRMELEQMKTQENNFLEFSKTREIEFWQAKLAQVRKGSVDYAAITQELYTLRKAKAKQDLDEQVAEIKANAARFKEGSQERVQAAKDAAQLIGQAYGQESVQFKNAQREVEAALRARVQQQRQMDEQLIDSKLQHAKTMNDIERDRLSFEVQMGTMTAQERIDSLRQLEQREYLQEMQALQQKLQIPGVEAQERQKINAQIEQLELTHQRRMVKLNQDSALESQRKWTTFWQPVNSAFTSGIAGIVMRTQTLRQAMVSVTGAMLQSFLSMTGTMLAEWIAKTSIMRALKAAFGIEAQAMDTATTIASIAAARAEAAGTIPAYASEGAAAAMASVAAIPFVGWAMAPGVGAAHFATAMSYMAGVSVPSAAGGWKVDQDGLAMIHEDERVLPARYSAGLDRMVESAADGGGSTGGDLHAHFHVSAIDAQSVERFFRTNRGKLAKTITGAYRDHALRTPK